MLDNPYRGHRFPKEIISECVWLYFVEMEKLQFAREALAAKMELEMAKLGSAESYPGGDANTSARGVVTSSIA